MDLVPLACKDDEKRNDAILSFSCKDYLKKLLYIRLGTVARAHGIKATPGWNPMPNTFFREDLVTKTFLRPFFPFHCFKKSSCQLMWDYKRFGNVRENLIFANICEFSHSRIQNSR